MNQISLGLKMGFMSILTECDIPAGGGVCVLCIAKEEQGWERLLFLLCCPVTQRPVALVPCLYSGAQGFP